MVRKLLKFNAKYLEPVSFYLLITRQLSGPRHVRHLSLGFHKLIFFFWKFLSLKNIWFSDSLGISFDDLHDEEPRQWRYLGKPLEAHAFKGKTVKRSLVFCFQDLMIARSLDAPGFNSLRTILITARSYQRSLTISSSIFFLAGDRLLKQEIHHQNIDQKPNVGEDNEWKDVQKKDTNKRPSETINRRKTRKKIINKTSYFLSNSLNKSLNQKWK